MGMRFHRAIRVAPGIRLNMSKGGGSLSLGPNGARINLGPQGVRTTVGVPGSGLSYISRRSWSQVGASPSLGAGVAVQALPASGGFMTTFVKAVAILFILTIGLAGMAFGGMIFYAIFTAG